MILILDTETTSIRPGQIAQIGYILAERGKLTAKNFFFKVKQIDPAAAAVNGFTVELLEQWSGGNTFIHNAIEIVEDLERAEYLAAHNLHFDLTFIGEECGRVGIALPPAKELDTMKLFTSVCKLPRKEHDGYKYPKLSELIEFLRLSEAEVQEVCRTAFGDGATYHDARFDATAVWMALLRGRSHLPEVDRVLLNNGF